MTFVVSNAAVPALEQLAAAGVPARRAPAARAVLLALAGFPGGRALAGELVAAIMRYDPARPLSHRQAKRWLKWASDLAPALLAKDPKSDEGTWYRLVGAGPAHAVAAADDAPVPDLDGVPREHRSDVALALLALLELGCEAGARELTRKMAEGAGRPISWAAMALDAARPYIEAVADTWEAREGFQVERMFALHPHVSGRMMRSWGRPLAYTLPPEPLAVKREVRRRLGAGRVRLAPAMAAVVGALAALGGRATREELAAWPYPPDQRAGARAALKALEDKGGYPPVVELARHRDRSQLHWYRLHPALGRGPGGSA